MNSQEAKKRKETYWYVRLLGGARNRNKVKGKPPPAIGYKFVKELWDLQSGKCYWTNLPMTTKQNSPWTVSLERLDCTKGYDPENVVLCGWGINRARGTLSVDEFRSFLREIAQSQSLSSHGGTAA